MRVVGLVVMAVMLLVACGAEGAPAGDTLPPPADGSIDGEWRAIAATVDGVDTADLDMAGVTMTIAGGHVTGSNGCNEYDRLVEVGDRTVEFGPGTATEAFCTAAPGEIEALFTELTSGVAAWSIDGDVLTLTSSTSVWTFERWTFTPGSSTTIASTSPVTSAPPVGPSPVSFELRPVVSCFPFDGEGPAPDESIGQTVLPDPVAGTWCIVGAAIGPGPVLGAPITVSLDPATDTWVVSPSVLLDGRAAWDQLTEQCFQRVEPCASGQIAIVLDGSIVSAPTVLQPTLPEVQISGDFTEAEAHDLADAIDADRSVVDGAPAEPFDETGLDPAGGMDGQAMYWRKTSDLGGEDALLEGSLFLGNNCIAAVLDAGGIVPILWRYGTRYDEAAGIVILPSGERIAFGDRVALGGGFHGREAVSTFTESAAALAEVQRCTPPGFEEVFVVQ